MHDKQDRFTTCVKTGGNIPKIFNKSLIRNDTYLSVCMWVQGSLGSSLAKLFT